jgi:hypothetical protein
MAIAPLKKLVPPPNQPLDVGSLHQWRLAERKLGLGLPSDYREFVFAYGSGLFARFYRVYNPFAADKSMSLLAAVKETCKWRRETRKEFPERVPYPIFPEAGGILPWGNDENGHDYYWFTRGPPDDWIVLSDDVRGNGLAEHKKSMTEYLLGVLRGDIAPLCRDTFTRRDFVFKPFKT